MAEKPKETIASALLAEAHLAIYEHAEFFAESGFIHRAEELLTYLLHQRNTTHSIRSNARILLASILFPEDAFPAGNVKIRARTAWIRLSFYLKASIKLIKRKGNRNQQTPVEFLAEFRSVHQDVLDAFGDPNPSLSQAASQIDAGELAGQKDMGEVNNHDCAVDIQSQVEAEGDENSLVRVWAHDVRPISDVDTESTCEGTNDDFYRTDCTSAPTEDEEEDTMSFLAYHDTTPAADDEIIPFPEYIEPDMSMTSETEELEVIWVVRPKAYTV